MAGFYIPLATNESPPSVVPTQLMRSAESEGASADQDEETAPLARQ
jgi:hypothetical protein